MQSEKVAVITGGTGALGKAVVKKFIDKDYRVVVTYRVATELEELKVSLEDAADRLDAYETDVTNESALTDFAGTIQDKYKTINTLVTLVGGFAPGTLKEGLSEQFDKMMVLNAKSFLLTVNAFSSLLSTPGSIVAVAAKPALEPAKNLGLYAASKAAVVSLVKTLALELRDRDITVNAIAPSTIDTPANRQAMTKADPSTWVTPKEIAKAVYYLATQRPTSGTIMPVYGKA